MIDYTKNLGENSLIYSRFGNPTVRAVEDKIAELEGGKRAGLYNAMPIEGVRHLVKFMEEFEKDSAYIAYTHKG